MNVRVWRFSLSYFFVFGGFVAMALWLPRYVIEAYGFDIHTAGLIGDAEHHDALLDLPRARAAVRPGRRQLRSSMANISFFFPKEREGSGARRQRRPGQPGRVGGAVPQPAGRHRRHLRVRRRRRADISRTASRQVWTQNAAFIWVPWIAIASFAAWFGMNDIANAKASFAEQAMIFRRKHNWLMCGSTSAPSARSSATPRASRC